MPATMSLVQWSELKQIPFIAREAEAIRDLREAEGTHTSAAPSMGTPALRDRAQHSTALFHSTLQESLSPEAGEALASNDAVRRSLAHLHERVGKRRLKTLAKARPKTELEVRCLCLRLECEGMSPAWPQEEG